MPVPKFSKFLHGTALLFQQRCAEMPYWFLPGGCPAWTAALCLLPLPQPQGAMHRVRLLLPSFEHAASGTCATEACTAPSAATHHSLASFRR